MAGPAYFSGVMNIAINEDWIVPFVYGALYDPNNVNAGYSPVDLTGSIIMMELRVRETDHEALVSVYSPDGGISIDGPGKFTVVILRNRLIRLAPGNYFSDLVRQMPSGYRERIWEGTAVVVKGTTR
jgi:hypothetical protein